LFLKIGVRSISHTGSTTIIGIVCFARFARITQACVLFAGFAGNFLIPFFDVCSHNPYNNAYGNLNSMRLMIKRIIMKNETLLTADYLDIIYHMRNKQYGSYELRRHYNDRLLRACLYLLSAIVLLSSALYFNSRKSLSPTLRSQTPYNLTEVKVPPPRLPQVYPPKPQQAPVKASTKFLTDPVLTNDPIKDKEQMTKIKDLTLSISGKGNIAADSPGIGNLPVGSTRSSVPAMPNTTTSSPRRIAEQMPQFIGNMAEYIARNLHYPEPARSIGIEGRVVIEFIVNEDGTVSNAHVARGIGGGCDEEALRMVMAMPGWHPGKQNGIPVKVYFSLPIKFELR
jgi:protein TonB